MCKNTQENYRNRDDGQTSSNSNEGDETWGCHVESILDRAHIREGWIN